MVFKNYKRSLEGTRDHYYVKFPSGSCNSASGIFLKVCNFLIPKRRIDKHFSTMELPFKSREEFAGPTTRAASIIVN